MLGHKCSFPNSHFLDSVVRNNKRFSGIESKTSDGLSKSKKFMPFQKLLILPLSWLAFLLGTVLWIVWTCDCYFFADFLMAAVLLVKNYHINLLKKVWYILLVLCTSFNSFSIQLETHQDNWNINVRKRTEAGAGVLAMKKGAPEQEPHLWKPKAPELEPCSRKEELRSCDIFTTAPQPWNNPRCSRAHTRSRVKIQQINCFSNNLQRLS